MQPNDRVIVPSYTWGEEGNPIMVSDKTYMKGTVDELRAISTDPDGVPCPALTTMPG